MASKQTFVVPGGGFEPPWVTPHAPQACASAKFRHPGTGWAPAIIARRAREGQSGRLAGEGQVGGGKYEEERDGGREAQHQRLPRPRAVEEARAAADGPQAFPFRSREDDDADHAHRQDEVRDQDALVHGTLLRSNNTVIGTKEVPVYEGV